jgi:hypothetical protein
MNSLLSRRPARWILTLVAAAGAAGTFLAAPALLGGAPAGVEFVDTGGHWVVPGLVYEGDGSCSAAACHGSDEAKIQSGSKIGDEYTIFTAAGEEGDPHARSWKTLASADSKAIAAKLKLESAQDSARCLVCHALEVPEPQRGKKYDITTGNSCESCHGPSQKWIEPHAKAGWTAGERSKLGTTGLLGTHGMLDTSDLALRAELCVACHLQIDKDLLDAGHPALRFEMYGYNAYFFDKTYTPHWDEPKGKGITARQWAIGQSVALTAAKKQVGAWKAKGQDPAAADELVLIYQQGSDLAAKHLKGGDVTGAACAAAAADLAGLAEGAKTDLHRKVIAFGVMALCEAAHDLRSAEPAEEIWAAFDTASAGKSGADYVAAVKKIAGATK